MTVRSTLLEKIKKGQESDSYLKNLKIEAKSKETSFKKLEKGIILFKNRICVPDNEDIKKEILLNITQPHIHFILAQQRWAKTKKSIIGGLE